MASHTPLPEGTDSIIDDDGASFEEEGDELEQGLPGEDIDDDGGFAGGDDDPSATPDPDTAGSSAAERSGSLSSSAAQQRSVTGEQGATAGDLRQQFTDRVEGLRLQAGDKARDFVQTGKDRATGALDDLVRTVEDAAGELDNRLGSQYGDYARRAAESIGSVSETFKSKDVDALFDDARDLVKKSPSIAIGIAAALGFVVARVVRAGVSDGSADAGGKTAVAG